MHCIISLFSESENLFVFLALEIYKFSALNKIFRMVGMSKHNLCFRADGEKVMFNTYKASFKPRGMLYMYPEK